MKPAVVLVVSTTLADHVQKFADDAMNELWRRCIAHYRAHRKPRKKKEPKK